MVKTVTNNKQYNVLALVIFLIFCFIGLFIINLQNINNTNYHSKYYDNIGINKDLLNIIYFNVGQADSTLITINDYTMLIDTGNDSDGYYIADFLKAQKINRIDFLILTHLDADHVGGTYKIVEELDIGTIYMPNMESNKKFYKEMMDAIEYHNVPVNKSLTASDDIEYKLRKCKLESAKHKL